MAWDRGNVSGPRNGPEKQYKEKKNSIFVHNKNFVQSGRSETKLIHKNQKSPQKKKRITLKFYHQNCGEWNQKVWYRKELQIKMLPPWFWSEELSFNWKYDRNWEVGEKESEKKKMRNRISGCSVNLQEIFVWVSWEK